MFTQQAFTGTAKLLKGGLHCHTTRSDGAGSPEEVIRLHVKNGYDFLALTDHRYYNFTNFAPECDITIIPGMEFDNTFYNDRGFRTYHTVCIGPTEGNGFSQDEKCGPGKAKNQEEFQAYLDEFHAKKNLTVYCHPQWSSTPARYFDKLEGNFAMEIWNSGCAMANDMDTDAAYWDELLLGGRKIYGVATDDGHGMDNHCNGWVRVNAENNVPAILKALEAGAFYSSCGPEIYDFSYDETDNSVAIKCSPCRTIRFIRACFPTDVKRAQNGEKLTEAKCGGASKFRYIRAVCIDENGKYAWTNPIFFD